MARPCDRLALGAVLLAALTWAPLSRAGGPLGPNGSPITTSEYSLDVYQGPVFAGTRVTGLGGAYVAIAEDVDGDLQNAATPAVRPFFSNTYFDYWLGFGVTFPATLSKVDFFNSGSTTSLQNAPDSFVFFTPALNLQFGEFGVGGTLEMQQYAISGGIDNSSVRVTIPTYHVQVAHGFANNQWVFGLGARIVTMAATGPTNEDSGFKSTGSGLEFGAVYKPEWMPFRLGAAVRTGIRTVATFREGVSPDENGDLVVDTPGGPPAYLPKTVALPYDVNFGFAVQFGKRPFNPPWRSTSDLIERETLLHRVRTLDREEELEQRLEWAKTQEEADEIRRTIANSQALDDRQLDEKLRVAAEHAQEQLRMMNRFYVQLTASMLISGPAEQAVGVESLVSQVVNRSGQKTVISERLGIEVGVVPDNLKLRAGSYLEPSRFETSDERLHGTAGIDIRLIKWNVFGLWPDDYIWRLGLGGDISRRYYTWGLTLGGWYPRRPGLPDSAAKVPE